MSNRIPTSVPLSWKRREQAGETTCAQRAELCVKACRGVSDEDLRKYLGPFAAAKTFMEQRDKLKLQNNLLLDALRYARVKILEDRQSLCDCHMNPITNTVSDELGVAGLAEYDQTLAVINSAIKRAEAFL